METAALFEIEAEEGGGEAAVPGSGPCMECARTAARTLGFNFHNPARRNAVAAAVVTGIAVGLGCGEYQLIGTCERSVAICNHSS